MPYMLDSSTPPPDSALIAAAAGGVVAWAGYLSSPGHPQGWAREDFDRVRAHGLAPVFVDLGTAAGRIGEVASAAGALPGDAVVTDVERGGAQLADAPAWFAAVRADGFRPWVYGTDATCDRAPAGATLWRARYGPEPTPAPDGAVQFQNTHTEYGVLVDRSVVGTEVFDMGMSPLERLDVARALTRLTYAAIGHRFPESGDVEDGWAQQGAGGTFDAMVEKLLLTGEFSADLAAEARGA